MRKKIAVALICSIILCVMLTSCGGGGAKVETRSSQTLGQELMDLEKAHEEGVITDKEYKKLKENMIKKYGK